jgi:glc operon protein GlcG
MVFAAAANRVWRAIRTSKLSFNRPGKPLLSPSPGSAGGRPGRNIINTLIINIPWEEDMRRKTLAILAACTAMTICGQAQAQQPAATPAAPAAVPDQMPFDVPYGNAITADRAADVAKAIVAEATKSPRNWKLAISVVDTHGELVYFYKMDNTQYGSVTISQNKARTAARLRRPTQIFNTAMQTPAGAYIATLDSPPPTASPGGIPLVEGGKIIGAVGCSGATGDQDAVACKAGVDTVK